jgi:hypothetical protein
MESTTHKECYRAKIPVWDDGRSKHGKSSQAIERMESTTHKECYLRAKIPVWDDRRSKHGKSNRTIARFQKKRRSLILTHHSYTALGSDGQGQTSFSSVFLIF